MNITSKLQRELLWNFYCVGLLEVEARIRDDDVKEGVQASGKTGKTLKAPSHLENFLNSLFIKLS